MRGQLLGDKDLNVTQIDVETYKGVVQLSGFVDTPEAKNRAGTVAASVSGVQAGAQQPHRQVAKAYAVPPRAYAAWAPPGPTPWPNETWVRFSAWASCGGTLPRPPGCRLARPEINQIIILNAN